MRYSKPPRADEKNEYNDCCETPTSGEVSFRFAFWWNALRAAVTSNTYNKLALVQKSQVSYECDENRVRCSCHNTPALSTIVAVLRVSVIRAQNVSRLAQKPVPPVGRLSYIMHHTYAHIFKCTYRIAHAWCWTHAIK